ncbi:MAG: transglutaminase domain-containing protein, partial [Microthrixaceae bacterium]
SRRGFAAEAAALCAVLAMFGLRSVPIRWIVRALTLVSGLLLARFGELGVFDGLSGSWRTLAWLAATAAALALAPSSRAVPGRAPGIVIHAEDVPSVVGASGPHGVDGGGADAGSAGGDRVMRRGGVPIALVIAAISLIGASALLIGPRTSAAFPIGASAGEVVDLGDNRSDNALVASDRLDMTTRPRLSEQVVMTVRSPIAAFWRTETYDTWDGSVWSRSGGRDGSFLDDGEVRAAPFDLAATEGEPTRQEFRMEVGFATAVPSAATPTQVDSVQPLAQRDDATLVSPAEPLSTGSTYTVESRQIPTTPEQLAATDAADVPDAVLGQYAQSPVATQRTIDLVDQLTQRVASDYEKVRAFEQWMDDNTEYSLDAPLSPKGVDVVDDFLFESRLGWCEQIASSLVVMSRLAGVPARLTTGFAPGQWDAVGGRFVVRESDAHAWAEVWFPEYGWVTFDPTAQVPLAGTEEATPGAAAIDWREVLGAVLVAVGVVSLAAGPVRRRVRRWAEVRTRRRERAELVRTRWDVAEEEHLERLGRDAGRERLPDETLTTYAAVVGATVGDASLAERGAQVDRVRYGGSIDLDLDGAPDDSAQLRGNGAGAEETSGPHRPPGTHPH